MSPSVPRLVLTGVGLVIAVIAIALDDHRLTWLAIATLAVALAMRFLGRGRRT